MSKLSLRVGSAALLTAGAWGADMVVERSPYLAGREELRDYDGTLELKWDNGTKLYGIVWFTGAGAWVGNEFNVATISEYRAIENIRFYSRDNWPDNRWDGCRIAVYQFTTVPGALLWGPKFVVGSGSGQTWCDFTVGWTLPASYGAFVAAVEQYYNYPGCDPFAVDSNRTFLGHSWDYYGGNWTLLSTIADPDRNLMVRVVVGSTTAVTPASVGRVKALY